MKNFLILLLLISAISCTKSINGPDAFLDPGVPNITNPPTQQNDSLTRHLGNGVVLRVSLKPSFVCDANDSSKPCTIFVNIVCTLTKAIDRDLEIEIIKTNVVEEKKTSGITGPPPTSVMITIPANQKELAFNSKFQVSSSIIDPEEFRIGRVTIFQKAD